MIQEQEATTMKHHHFLITCFPLQGHINPTLQLAKNLARLGAKVTFATTIRFLETVQDRLPTLNGLSYVSFSDGHDQESVLSAAYISDLRRFGSENLTKILEKFRDEGQPVSCLVYSLLIPWASAVARDMHVPAAFLAIQCATAFAIYHRFFSSHDNIYIHDSSVSVSIQDLPLFSSSDLPTFLLPDNPLNPFMGPMMREHIQEIEKVPGSLVFVNTFQELEKEAIKSLDQNKVNVIAIGPLIPSAFSDGNDSTDKSFGGDLYSKNEDYFRWLDSKPERSVVYVAFGSLVVMNKEQKIEVLRGLAESKRSFLWVIRSSSDSEEEDVKKMLENELSNGGGIIVPWCAQLEVLSHKSIGCFVTHCGWNSTLESLVCGVPLIACPHNSDQTTNAKLVEDVWGTGVRARANGEVVTRREEFKKCIDVVMGNGDRGKEIRNNAWRWRGLAMEAVKDGGSTYNNLRKVLESS